MRRGIAGLLWLPATVLQVSALQLDAPDVLPSGRAWMADNTASFGEGLGQILRKGLAAVRPEWQGAAETAVFLVCVVLLVSVLQSVSGRGKRAGNLAAAVVISAGLLTKTNTMISLGVETVTEISEYGKLLLPVMTAAMAAQGGIAASAALYAGTAAFNAVISQVMTGLLIPGIYVYLALAICNVATEEPLLKRLAELIRGSVSWILKILLIVFTSYLSLTGVVSGTTDAAALKATKVAISSVVPVVGGILSDASEAVLVSAGLMKNAAGIYGILAVAAMLIHPFFRIGIQYLVLKLSAAVCGIFGNKEICSLIDHFSAVMGILLAMTGSSALLVLISTVCFMKGVG